MFAALDIGNSFVKIQLFSSSQLTNYYKLSHEEIDRISEINTINSVAISSVVPRLTKEICKIFEQRHVLPFIINSESKLNFTNLYATPHTLGADRICNISGALSIGSTKAHKLIIDFGTATNLNYVNEKNEFIGGAIAPGISTMKFSLLSKTSQLIDVDFNAEINSLGKSTKECIQSGIIYCQKGLIESFIRDLNLKATDLEIYITGGFSDLMKSYLDFNIIHERKLSLLGIKKLYEINN